MRGTYYEQIFIELYGTPESTIVIMPYDSDSITIDGENSPIVDWGRIIYIRNSRYIEIRNFYVKNAGPGGNAAGIMCENCEHIKIIGNHTFNTTSSGIGVWNSHHISIDSNEVVLVCNDGEEECISVDSSWNVRVSYNFVHDGGPGNNGGEGIDVKNVSHQVEIFQKCN